MNHLKRILNSRVFKVGSLILVQMTLLVLVINAAATVDYGITVILTLLSVVIVVYIINRHDNPAYKLTWSIIILGVPLVGGVGYLLFGGRVIPKALSREMIKSLDESNALMLQDQEVSQIAENLCDEVKVQLNYVKNNSYYPYYNDTNTDYFASGEAMLPRYLEDLKNAKHFIFLEYFIISEGYMWDNILEILITKVAQGVNVYLLYDDGGCLDTLDLNYYKKLRKLGIIANVFNPVRAKLTITMNNRDHRKITVIDNKIAYTGGLNLADEYINRIERFGYWKDNAIRLEGKAVWNFTVMFIQFFNASTKEEHLDYLSFRLDSGTIKNAHFVLPFSDSPTDKEEVGRTVHLNMINKAKRYIYMHTPYLIIDHDMIIALTLASKNGVEVVITTPHIPDKPYAFAITRSNYDILVESGIKIYEFTPGFIHSKVFVSDDQIALVGTINMDYRSYYLHYECGVLVSDPKTIEHIKQDYLETLDKSMLMTKEILKKANVFQRIARALLNIFAPLM